MIKGQIGFFGLGIMGSRMAMNILKAGFPLRVYNRTASKTKDLEDAGAAVASSVSDLAQGSDIFMTMLADPVAVAENALGEEGFLNSLKPGTTWVDFSTVSPGFSLQMAKEATTRKLHFVDAPVSGTRLPAENGELTIFVGGKENELKYLIPLFEAVGSKILFLGENGKASAVKMVVNLMLANAMASFAEGMTLGRALGLDHATLAEILIGGPVAAPFLASKNVKMATEDYSTDFPLKHMLKDLFLATREAYHHNISMPETAATRELYAMAVNQGLGDMDFSAIYKLLGG